MPTRFRVAALEAVSKPNRLLIPDLRRIAAGRKHGEFRQAGRTPMS